MYVCDIYIWYIYICIWYIYIWWYIYIYLYIYIWHMTYDIYIYDIYIYINMTYDIYGIYIWYDIYIYIIIYYIYIIILCDIPLLRLFCAGLSPPFARDGIANVSKGVPGEPPGCLSRLKKIVLAGLHQLCCGRPHVFWSRNRCWERPCVCHHSNQKQVTNTSRLFYLFFGLVGARRSFEIPWNTSNFFAKLEPIAWETCASGIPQQKIKQFWCSSKKKSLKSSEVPKTAAELKLTKLQTLTFPAPKT